MTVHRRFVNGAEIHYAGSLEGDRLLIVIGRENYKKSSRSIDVLVWRLHSLGLPVIWFNSKEKVTEKFLDARIEQYFYSKPWNRLRQNCPGGGLIRKAMKAAFLLGYPGRWGYFLKSSKSNKRQSKRLRHFIRQYCTGKSVFILSHSAGGIVSSLVEDEASVKKLVCFGYPFKHPEKEDEPIRTRHLTAMQKPFLIIQGRQDEYGGAEVLDRYTVSPSTTISLIDSGHDYDTFDHEVLEEVFVEIKQFLAV